MSNLWKKLKQNIQTGDKSKSPISHTNDQNSSENFENSRRMPLLITPSDEALLKNAGDAYNPLVVHSQIAQSLTEALQQKSSATSSYKFFAEYLESKEMEFLLLFLEEIEKYQRTLFSLDKNLKNAEENTFSNKECFKDDKSCNYVLPDLVSNIPKNVVVTPNHSPEDEIAPFASLIREDDNKPCQNTEETSSLCCNSPLPSTCSAVSHDVSVIVQDNRIFSFNIASHIFNKYIDIKCEHSIGVSNHIRSLIEERLSASKLNEDLFFEAKEEVISTLEKYYSKYVESQYFLKHEIEVLTGEEVLLQDVLRSESALPYFMEYLEQEGSQSLLEFWISVSNFRNHLHCNDYKNPEQSQTDAMILYDKYFSLQARTPIGFSDEIRLKVESNICHEEGPLHDCFDLPLRIVFHILERDHLSGYLSSSLHMNLLRELVNKVKIHSKHSRKGSVSLSTDSSEQSCSTKVSINEKNTLLAMDSSHGLELLRNLSNPAISMRIDSNQILDPDSLWRRKNFTKLSCGYVDQYGRFESDIQPEPGKRQSRLSKTLKKITNKEENKAKEDLAYKVAEMIIKDVTNVTLGEGTPSLRSSNQVQLPSEAATIPPPIACGKTDEFCPSKTLNDQAEASDLSFG